MSKNPSVIVLDANPDHFPPWSAEQQDAQLEALRFAFHHLARTLHENGQLSIPALNENLRNAEWLFADKRPDTRDAVRQIAAGLDYMQTKVKPLPRRGRKRGQEGSDA